MAPLRPLWRLLLLLRIAAAAKFQRALVTSGRAVVEVHAPGSISAVFLEADDDDIFLNDALPGSGPGPSRSNASGDAAARRRRRSLPAGGVAELEAQRRARLESHLAIGGPVGTSGGAASGVGSLRVAHASNYSSFIGTHTDRSAGATGDYAHAGVGSAAGGAAVGDFLDGRLFETESKSSEFARGFHSAPGGSTSTSSFFTGAVLGMDSLAILELHLHNVTMQQLRKSLKTSVVDLLMGLHREFVKASGLEHFQIKILGIHGRYLVHASPTGRQPHGDEEVVVKFSVAPVEAKAGERDWLLEALNERLSSPDNSLLASSIAFAFHNTSVVEAQGGSASLASSRLYGKHAAGQVGPLLLPIAVSAAFTGVLVWLAAL